MREQIQTPNQVTYKIKAMQPKEQTVSTQAMKFPLKKKFSNFIADSCYQERSQHTDE